jgi:hypothetical protein
MGAFVLSNGTSIVRHFPSTAPARPVDIEIPPSDKVAASRPAEMRY